MELVNCPKEETMEPIKYLYPFMKNWQRNSNPRFGYVVNPFPGIKPISNSKIDSGRPRKLNRALKKKTISQIM